MLFSLVLIAGCLLFAPSPDPSLRFVARTDTSEIDLEAYYSPIDSTYYLFVPSGCDRGEFLFDSKGLDLVVDGRRLCQGDPLTGWVEDELLPITIGRRHSSEDSRLCVKCASGVATMDIRLSNRVLERLVKDQEFRGYASMSLYSTEGRIEDGWHGRSVTLKGRGNSTWWKPKKPFLLTLDRTDTLLGMAEGQKWVLLANAMDFSNLRNKVVLDFARSLDMGWNPDCRFVNLFFNGKYYGLYLLTEKVEFSDTRLNPEQYPSYLLLNDIEQTILKSGMPHFAFISDQHVGVMDARASGGVPLDSIKESLDRFKGMLLSPDDVTDSVLASVVDIESWAGKYLIDELFLNGDVWRRSNYFYCMGHAPYIFYSGPVWDYDLAMASTHEEIFAESDQILPIYTMCRSKSFQNVADSIYYHYGRPYVMGLLDHRLDSLAQRVEASATANAIRWEHDKGLQTSSSSAVDSLKHFFQQRVVLLDSYFSHSQQMQFVTLESTDPGLRGFYSTVVYRPGSSVSDYLALPEGTSNDAWVWVDSASGHFYTLDSVPPPGCRLNIVTSTDTASNNQDAVVHPPFPIKKWLLRIVLFVLFSISFLCIVIHEWRSKWK